jgi:hypothetical protein
MMDDSAVREADQSSADLVSVIGELRQDLDRLVPHLLAVLKRNEAEERQRIANLERAAKQLPTWPLAAGVNRFVHRMVQTDMDPELLDSIVEELGMILTDAGFSPFGKAADRFDPDRHVIVDSESEPGPGVWVVSKVYAEGLESFGGIVDKAKVTVTRQDGDSRGD